MGEIMQGMELVNDLEQQGLKLKAENRGSEVSHNTAKILFAFIHKYQEILPQLNPIKKQLDDAYQSKDLDAFETALSNFKHVSYKLYDEKRALKSRRKMSYLKIQNDVFQETLKKINYLESTITNSEHWLKYERMSPAKRARVRMSMMWG
jgi:hypothetical protein